MLRYIWTFFVVSYIPLSWNNDTLIKTTSVIFELERDNDQGYSNTHAPPHRNILQQVDDEILSNEEGRTLRLNAG